MTKSGIWRALCVAAVVVALAGAAACGDDDDSGDSSSDTTESDEGGSGSSVVESAQELCDSMESLDSTVQDIEVDPDTTTIADVKDGLDQLRSEVSDVASSGSALAGALGTALQSAFDRFESSVEDLPEDETLQAAGEAARSAADEFEQSWDAAMEALDCERSSGS
jgi:hypothetical protein